MPLINRKKLDVTLTEMNVIDQRAPRPNWSGWLGFLGTGSCLHVNRRSAAPIVAALGSSKCALVE